MSAAPGDFDGDGSMDLMTVSVKENVKSVHIMWGQVTKLECIEHRVTIPDIFSEPLVFDYNKDWVSDLLTVDKDGNRTNFQVREYKEWVKDGDNELTVDGIP